VTQTFARDAQANATKLIDETRGRGRDPAGAGGRGVKVATKAKELPGCGRTLITVFDVGASQRRRQSDGASEEAVLLRVDAYVCATSARLSLLLEGSDLLHVVGDDDRVLLSSAANSEELDGKRDAEERRRRLAMLVLDHLRVEQRRDGRGDRLVLSDYAPSSSTNKEDRRRGFTHGRKGERLYKSLRAIGHDQVLLTAYLEGDVDEEMDASEKGPLQLRLELYEPSSSARCSLTLGRHTLSAILGLPQALVTRQALTGGLVTTSGRDQSAILSHVCSFVHLEKLPPVSDGPVDAPSTIAMALLFDEQQAMACMERLLHHQGAGEIESSEANVVSFSWMGMKLDSGGGYFAVHLELLDVSNPQQTSRQQPLSSAAADRLLLCSAFSPSEMLVATRRFEVTELPVCLPPQQAEVEAGQTTNYSSFCSEICQRLHVEIVSGDDAGETTSEESGLKGPTPPAAIALTLR
ncbi:hypothetical protein BBJ28_00011234, partial [Nothophytophthora sp. Chile5]